MIARSKAGGLEPDEWPSSSAFGEPIKLYSTLIILPLFIFHIKSKFFDCLLGCMMTSQAHENGHCH